jgi:hypothetical protein
LRTSVDLIREFDAFSATSAIAYLAITFNETTTLIKSNEPDKLSKLDALLRLGGRPIGLMRLVPISILPGRGKIETRPFAEFDTQPARDWLNQYAVAQAAQLEADGRLQIVRGEN